MKRAQCKHSHRGIRGAHTQSVHISEPLYAEACSLCARAVTGTGHAIGKHTLSHLVHLISPQAAVRSLYVCCKVDKSSVYLQPCRGLMCAQWFAPSPWLRRPAFLQPSSTRALQMRRYERTQHKSMHLRDVYMATTTCAWARQNWITEELLTRAPTRRFLAQIDCIRDLSWLFSADMPKYFLAPIA